MLLIIKDKFKVVRWNKGVQSLSRVTNGFCFWDYSQDHSDTKLFESLEEISSYMSTCKEPAEYIIEPVKTIQIC